MSQAEGSYRGTVGTGTDTHTPNRTLRHKRKQEKRAEDHPKLVWVQLTVSKATGGGGETPKEEEKTQGRVSGDTNTKNK